MDYEKLHKDTINKLQQMVSCGKITVETACGICADFVPESEDEKIWKWIVGSFDRLLGTIDCPWDKEYVLNLLEKKGEQKPVEKHSCECIHVGFHVNGCKRWCHSYQKEVPYIECNTNCNRYSEQKPAWSEEDEARLTWVLNHIESNDLEKFNDAENWLKSLRPQNRWKPSDTQMAAIACAVRNMKESACYNSELVSLFDDLKKLREE